MTRDHRAHSTMDFGGSDSNAWRPRDRTPSPLRIMMSQTSPSTQWWFNENDRINFNWGESNRHQMREYTDTQFGPAYDETYVQSHLNAWCDHAAQDRYQCTFEPRASVYRKTRHRDWSRRRSKPYHRDCGGQRDPKPHTSTRSATGNLHQSPGDRDGSLSSHNQFSAHDKQCDSNTRSAKLDPNQRNKHKRSWASERASDEGNKASSGQRQEEALKCASSASANGFSQVPVVTAAQFEESHSPGPSSTQGAAPLRPGQGVINDLEVTQRTRGLDSEPQREFSVMTTTERTECSRGLGFSNDEKRPNAPKQETEAHMGFSVPSAHAEAFAQEAGRDDKEALRHLVKPLITCSVCSGIFNRSVVCKDFLIQLNEPIQCLCGCVTCTACYHNKGRCPAHKLTSKNGAVNTTASYLASCPNLEHVGEWDVDLEIGDRFKTDREIHACVKDMMDEENAPTEQELGEAFQVLQKARDAFCFKYWPTSDVPEYFAYRYVCLPHLPGFWDHIVVGTRPKPQTERMIGRDEHLPKLFNVELGHFNFHWCCFAFKKQVILAIWCTSMLDLCGPKVVPLLARELRNLTGGQRFKRMVFCLYTWLKIQYGSASGERAVRIVLDCKPSEGSSLLHILTLLASKCGMCQVAVGHPQQPKHDLTYKFDPVRANAIFACPFDYNTEKFINLVEAFKQ